MRVSPLTQAGYPIAVQAITGSPAMDAALRIALVIAEITTIFVRAGARVMTTAIRKIGVLITSVGAQKNASRTALPITKALKVDLMTSVEIPVHIPARGKSQRMMRHAARKRIRGIVA